MDNKCSSSKLSHTRGVHLGDLAGLCFILRERGTPTSVKTLATEAIERGILDYALPAQGNRLPTRINHHMIALRELGLVESARSGANTHYNLTPPGYAVAEAVSLLYEGTGTIALEHNLRAAWRPVLVQSLYVRCHWLKYFMPKDTFDYKDLILEGESVTIYRVPLGDRFDSEDSGYRLVSRFWKDQYLDLLARREVYEGLRRWTNEAYLTDDRLPEGMETPFLYLTSPSMSDVFQLESYVVRAWLDPDWDRDVDLFERQVQQVFDDFQQSNRITIPEIIINLSHDYGYSKHNATEMLKSLYYHRSKSYFFERGSEFLVNRTFDVARPQDYYVQIEGVWRTSLIRY